MNDGIKHDIEMEKKYAANEPIENCIRLAAGELNSRVENTYVVMFSFVLGGYKAFCSSSEVHDTHGHYVEVVYNDKKNEFYVIHYEDTNRMTIAAEILDKIE